MDNFGSLLLNNFLPNLAYQLPVLIVLLVGLVIAIARWRKSPRTSLLTLLAIFIVLFVTVLGVFTNSTLSFLLYQTLEMDFSTARIVFIVLSIALNLLTACGWVLLLMAIFSKKKPQDKST
jgi:hypothetical protein